MVARAGLVALSPLPRAAARRQAPPRRAVRAAAQQQPEGGGRPSKRHLKDPAKLEGSSTATVQVQDRGGALALDAYMRLPTEQYNELDPAMIASLGDSSFLLRVPRVSLFNVWVEPEVAVDVRLDEGSNLVFESGQCTLKGSELLQRLRLDEKFTLYFHTVLTWQPVGKPSSASTNGSANGRANGSANGNGNANSSANGTNGAAATAAAAGRPVPGSIPPGPGSISAKATVQVWSEVVGPFQAIPRGILQGTGNAVLGALMQALLPVFLKKLADDYVRWAGDPAYRARRAAASSPPPPPAAAQPTAAAAAAAGPSPPRS